MEFKDSEENKQLKKRLKKISVKHRNIEDSAQRILNSNSNSKSNVIQSKEKNDHPELFSFKASKKNKSIFEKNPSNHKNSSSQHMKQISFESSSFGKSLSRDNKVLNKTCKNSFIRKSLIFKDGSDKSNSLKNGRSSKNEKIKKKQKDLNIKISNENKHKTNEDVFIVKDPKEISKITDFFNPPRNNHFSKEKITNQTDVFKKKSSKSKTSKQKENSTYKIQNEENLDEELKDNSRGTFWSLQNNKEGETNSNLCKLLNENKILKKKLLEKEENFGETMKMYQDQIQKNTDKQEKMKESLTCFLLENANLKKQILLREITDEKAQLGFFAFNSGFSTSNDDWIQGVAIRQLIEEKVNQIIPE